MEFQHQARKNPSLLRKPVFSFIGCCLSGVILSNTAHSATLTQWEFDPSNNQLTLSLEAQTTPNIFILTDPPRLVIDLPDTQISDLPRQQNYPGNIKEIRASQFDEETTRLVLEFSPETRFSAEPFQISPTEANGWLIRPRFETTATATNLPLPPANASPPKEDITVQVPPLPGNNNNLTPSLPQTTRTPMIEFGQPLPPPRKYLKRSSQY